MYLSHLSLENFRSYPKKSLEFTPHVNLISGPNGSGKTNILEAIYFLSTGKSFRASSSYQLLNWNQPYTIVNGQVGDELLEVQLSSNPGKSTLSRRFFIDQVIKTRPKYLGELKTVIFEPEDIRLVGGSPGRRRDFLDSVFTTTEWRYATALAQYNRALKHRNELLDLIRTGLSQRSELFYWDQSLVKNSQIIFDFRQKFFQSANSFFQNHENDEVRTISLQYFPSIITPAKLEANYSLELARGYTSIGPHREDFQFNNSIFPAVDKNLALWGSRGQQRLAVLALRLAQINHLETTYKSAPILLLDDIFSELDLNHRRLVGHICHQYQTIFTSADENFDEYFPDFKPNIIKITDLNLPPAQT
ncbi:DNA replication and repair protein RecF [Candidatus Shapirobacteria bacterium]|nr:DNA replication and repair protein RecF [Candidatus Shapirobacteria bacterium]